MCVFGMFNSISSLFESRKTEKSSVSDVKFFIENYLREQIGSDGVYCQTVDGGRVTIRVINPAIQQEIVMLDYDVRRVVSKEMDYNISSIVVNC